MILISHRGNIDSINRSCENSIDYIQKALDQGFYVEIDLWQTDEGLFLGHDFPQYEIQDNFLNNNKLFVHCKNIQALGFMTNNKFLCEYFWHENDHCTLTSKLNIWVYPGKQLIPGSIAVLPEVDYKGDLSVCYGICSDFIAKYKVI